MNDERYEKDGKFYDRPTHILDYFYPPELVDWKVRVGATDANKISRLALKHGSRIDELVRSGKDPKKTDSDEVKSCWIAWKKWLDEYQPKKLIFPETAYCNTRMIAGTPDIYWEERQELIDVKSSKALHEGYLFQVGGCYASLPLPFPVKSIAILRLDKEIQGYAYTTNKQLGLELPVLTNGFNGLLAYYRTYKLVQSTLKPKEKVYDGNSCE